MEWGRGYLRRGKRIGDERFESVRGERVIVIREEIGAPTMLRLICNAVTLAKMLPTLDLSFQ